MSDLSDALAHSREWPEADKMKLLPLVQKERWLRSARPEQLPPAGNWRIWYLMGGRGSGKTKAAAEWLSDAEAQNPPGEWAIVAPTMADAITTCTEQTLLPILGNRVANYNRSRFEIHLKSGSYILLDGADDGALRIQGHNLRGAWCVARGELVQTRNGLVPIEKVTTKDEVATRNGWKPVLAWAKTKDDAPVLRVSTFDGHSVRCTPDHPIWVYDKGWVEAQHVTVGDRLCLWTPPPDLPRGSTGVGFGGIGTDRATTRTALASLCTRLSGSRRWASEYLRGWWSTILTMIAPTTSRRISSPCHEPIILQSTASWVNRIQWKYEPRSAERSESHGRSENRDLTSVSTAERPTTQLVSDLASVLRHAATPSTVRSIEWDGRSDVYDLTVADDHEFFASGILVKNCDEVGLWVKWDQAWNESLAFAVRQQPAQMVACGTPKMGHGLVRLLVEDESIPVSSMRTSDNVANLSDFFIADVYQRYAGTRLGKQELDGEWISALEGDLLKRSWWRYYEPKRKTETMQAFVKRMPRFQMVVVSVDTPLKDKESSDFVAIQVWGVDRANRYLLDARTEKMGYDQAKRAIVEMSRWARTHWRCQHWVLIENAGYGVELLVDLKREIGLVQKTQPNVDGNKGMRAMSASGDLESGNVFLPGRIKDDMSGPDERVCPAFTLSLVEEAALFQVDGSHGSHDDQVDAWSQAMNWLRNRRGGGLSVASVTSRLR